MEEKQKERELVYGKMVRKCLIIIYLYVDPLFILFISSQEIRLFYLKTMFSMLF